VSFIVQRASGTALSLSQVAGDVLRIGRGTNAELRSENPAVALEHAIITRDETGYTITDKGSITGTYVNGKPVESQRLKKGDKIDVGDLRIDVELADPLRAMFVRVVAAIAATPVEEKRERERAAIAGVGAVKADKVDFADAYRLRRPYLTKLSIIAIALIVTLAVIGEVTRRENQQVFMPGGVSSAHLRARDPMSGQPIANNCAACHDPWNGVSDQKCIVCHQQAPHAEVEKAPPKCVDCHMEHRGAAKLALIADEKCTTCHADLSAHRTRATLPASDDHVINFDTHPEFAVLTDPDTLKFNHKLHLQRAGIFNANGKREILTCTGCHGLVETKGRVDPAPITFDNDCRRCHQLTFDIRFPDAQVPHGGDPGLVYGFVLATYAGNRDIVGKSPEEVRRILTTRQQAAPDERAVLNAEQVIKTKCALCHDIRRDKGKLAATPPVVTTRWWMHSHFSHTQHRSIDCESCHGAARMSVATSDALLPTRSNCVDCHGIRGAGRVSSRCVTCHDYHERSKSLLLSMSPAARAKRIAAAGLDGGGAERMIEPILLIAIAILMLVVAVPVAIFIYQRLVASAPKVPTARELKQQAALPTTKVPPINVAAPPTPVSPPTPASGVTKIVEPGDIPGAAVDGEGTAMVQWYGMLLCTAGPLEGQRFIVEEEGLYIGRDPKLSQIVVNDTRVSKRHVRILPRNGKVFAIDQDSTNGTFMGKAGGDRLTEQQLKRGDVIVLADNAATFTYQI